MMVIGPTRLFPLLIALLLAVLSYALERAVREGPSGAEPRRHDPDYIVDRFTVTSYGADGTLESRVTAEKMNHYPDDGMTDVIALRGMLSKPNSPRYRVSADRVAVAEDGEEVFLFDHVVMIREADATRPEARLETDFLHFVGGPDIVHSDHEVRLQDGGNQLAGRGMEYHRDSGQFYLRDRVRGRFMPRERKPR